MEDAKFAKFSMNFAKNVLLCTNLGKDAIPVQIS